MVIDFTIAIIIHTNYLYKLRGKLKISFYSYVYFVDRCGKIVVMEYMPTVHNFDRQMANVSSFVRFDQIFIKFQISLKIIIFHYNKLLFLSRLKRNCKLKLWIRSEVNAIWIHSKKIENRRPNLYYDGNFKCVKIYDWKKLPEYFKWKCVNV